MKKRRILVTSALPYANGPIHLGHLVEYIQTDIWVRFQKACGHEVYYFCADDTHGTPVMIAARNAATEPEQLVERVHAEHLRDLSAFDVDFDNYYTTNSPENRELACGIYENSKAAGHIARRDVAQLYCEHDQMFLPDRFVKGECPSCGAADQYGDSCDNCSATYAPRDLKNAACSICGNAPVERNSEHLFFKLSDFQKFLEDWLAEPGHVDDGVRKKMNEWLHSGLRDWDISRDGPYFGFEIPGEENKYFYVWLDAPIGYMASSKNYFEKTGQKKLFDEFWNAEVSAKKNTEVYHFIGKDI
ncbi:MAG: class I tRNA ligase family protein, partial [Leptospiraceae bacterium]|nr:class I tRNA ligase family protein [Leptospiraceae bacterium]